MKANAGLLNVLRGSGADWVIPTAAVAMVFVMLVPLPGFVLDLLFTISITASVLVLLAAIQILRPVQFSVFPSLLLLLTLFRLSLALASTRRILLHGNEGPGAAGKVIEAFGQFVVGGNFIVGFVLFVALIAIQFLVVSHGAVRTAEVTAPWLTTRNWIAMSATNSTKPTMKLPPTTNWPKASITFPAAPGPSLPCSRMRRVLASASESRNRVSRRSKLGNTEN